MSNFLNWLIRILGGHETQTVTGVAAFTILRGLRGYAITVRTQGTVIASINVQEKRGDPVVAYVPTWLGIVCNQGDYFVSYYPIVNITLTAATDSISIHCDKPY